MRNLSTITMAILCVMLVVACQQDPDGDVAFKAGMEAFNREDYEEALKWFTNAANKDHTNAQLNLGGMYENGKGVSQNYKEALKWYKMAAEKGYSSAQFNLGVMYVNGRGVSQNYKEALKWWKKAAKNGNLQAQFNLGVMYGNGRGVSQNYKEALKWYKMAAEKGHTNAPVNIGYMFYNEMGVERNYEKAFRLFLLAAQQGDVLGQFNVGKLSYTRGIYEEAYYWYNLAKKKEKDFVRVRDTTTLDTLNTHIEKIAGYLDHKKINVLQELTGDGWKPRQFVGSGSGFFISKEYILTNAHVVCANYPASPCEPYDEVRTTYYRLKIEKDKIDIDVDLALLKVVSSRKDSTSAKISREPSELGESIAVFGYPLAERLSYEGNFTIGNVSARTGRPINVTPSDFFQFTAPIQPGNSGGPVLDAAGNVVGVVANLERVPDNWRVNIAQNINFAVSLKAIKNFLKEAGVEPYASSTASSQKQWDRWEVDQAADVAIKEAEKLLSDIESGQFSSGSYFSSRDTIKAWTEVAKIAEDFTVPILCFTYKE